jgi:hypothetical protein
MTFTSSISRVIVCCSVFINVWVSSDWLGCCETTWAFTCKANVEAISKMKIFWMYFMCLIFLICNNKHAFCPRVFCPRDSGYSGKVGWGNFVLDNKKPAQWWCVGFSLSGYSGVRLVFVYLSYLGSKLSHELFSLFFAIVGFPPLDLYCPGFYDCEPFGK